MSKLIALCLLSVIGAVPMQAQAQSMHEAVSYALETNPAIEGARAAREATRYEKKSEFSHFLPELSASFTGGRVYQDNSTSRGLTSTRGAAYSGYGEGSISVRQMLFDGMETSNRMDAVQAHERADHFNIVETQERITSDVVRSYIEILRLRSGLLLLRSQMREVADYQHRIKEMVDEGMSDEAELQQSRDVSMIIDTLKAEYEGQLIAVEAAYIKVVGVPASHEMIIPNHVQAYVEKDLDGIIKQAQSSHPLVRIYQMRAVAAKHAVGAEEGKLYPDFTGELSHYKVDKKDVVGGESEDSRAVVKMNWSFSTGGKEISAVDRKRAEYLETMSKVEEIKRNVESGIREAYARYLTYWRKTVLSQQRVELNQKLMSTYQSQFEGSRISLLALMRAQSQLFKAKLENNDNGYNLLSSQYATLGARGELTDILLASEKPE